MLSFKLQGIQFNVRAAAVILEDGFLLLHRAEGDSVWALPGGRVEPGETASDAVVRELREETGEVVRCANLMFCVENFFDWQGTPSHEIGYYFYAHLPEPSRIREKLASHLAREEHVALEYRWFRLTELNAVNLYPEFLRTVSLRSEQPVQHIVQGTPFSPRSSEA